MKPRYLRAETAGRDRWMISYLDVMTILLIFFVSVAATGLETTKAVEADKTVEPAPPQTALHQELEHSSLDWRADPRGVAISLPQAVLFPAGKAEVNASALPVVAQIADILREIPNKISVGGHADPEPIHNRLFKSNWELAAARSLSLLDLLTTRFGIAESRFSIASYGSNDPRNSNDTPAGRASNRRVEILILDELANR
jgi:chemotaxis protein MotB